jgi:phosphohistidine phosphatase SixA
MKHRRLFLGTVAMLLSTGLLQAQALSGDALVKALRQGGYIIVMRHTSSPREAPAKDQANADNLKSERQLDEEGRRTAAGMGKALRDLKIPIGEVLSSPTYRALETVKYAQFGSPKTFAELGDNGQSMQGGTEAQAAWLRKRVTQTPTGTNTVMVTHLPNLTRAFPQPAAGMEDGEALIFGSEGRVLARVKIDEWSKIR